MISNPLQIAKAAEHQEQNARKVQLVTVHAHWSLEPTALMMQSPCAGRCHSRGPLHDGQKRCGEQLRAPVRNNGEGRRVLGM